jgi:dipeptidase D
MSDGWIGREVAVSGLKGGHSGLQIHKRLANAIKLLTDALFEVQDAGVNFRLGSIKGGSAHNVIPHAAIAQLSIVPDMAKALETVMDRVSATLRTEWGKDEHDLALEVRQIPAPKQVMADQSRDLLLRLLEDLPHGVLAMSKSFPGKVETSSNLAYIQMRDGEVEIMTSSRSFIDAELRKVQSRILSLGEAIGAEVEVQEGYPGWEPNPSSWLLKLTEKIYQQVYGRLPEIRVTHGGLECGVIVSKLPGMEAISFGPLIRGGHTSEEHVYASTVPHTWKLLTALLEALCSY